LARRISSKSRTDRTPIKRISLISQKPSVGTVDRLSRYREVDQTQTTRNERMVFDSDPNY